MRTARSRYARSMLPGPSRRHANAHAHARCTRAVHMRVHMRLQNAFCMNAYAHAYAHARLCISCWTIQTGPVPAPGHAARGGESAEEEEGARFLSHLAEEEEGARFLSHLAEEEEGARFGTEEERSIWVVGRPKLLYAVLSCCAAFEGGPRLQSYDSRAWTGPLDAFMNVGADSTTKRNYGQSMYWA